MTRAAETGQPYCTPLDPPPVELDLPFDGSTTLAVKPPRNREEGPHSGPELSSPASTVAEEKAPYGQGVKIDANTPTPEQLHDLVDTIREHPDLSHLPPEYRGGADKPALGQEGGSPPEETLFPDNEVETKNVIPSIKEAALALHACVPDDEKVEREKLLLDAAWELGHTKLTKKVRRTLNKALNTEKNAGRLKTDWQLVWKPRKR